MPWVLGSDGGGDKATPIKKENCGGEKRILLRYGKDRGRRMRLYGGTSLCGHQCLAGGGLWWLELFAGVDIWRRGKKAIAVKRKVRGEQGAMSSKLEGKMEKESGEVRGVAKLCDKREDEGSRSY
ncbi:hypothetical protein HAX54_052832 [Datura stramonium]|uniref:Uncharacterized protein n=1 Tax=Datura stramonium TaxID=4076 RepID=A0ABS8WRJ5_DATST|nr:hypothetical protein [Datura stramonium]